MRECFLRRADLLSPRSPHICNRNAYFRCSSVGAKDAPLLIYWMHCLVRAPSISPRIHARVQRTPVHLLVVILCSSLTTAIPLFFSSRLVNTSYHTHTLLLLPTVTPFGCLLFSSARPAIAFTTAAPIVALDDCAAAHPDPVPRTPAPNLHLLSCSQPAQPLARSCNPWSFPVVPANTDYDTSTTTRHRTRNHHHRLSPASLAAHYTALTSLPPRGIASPSHPPAAAYRADIPPPPSILTPAHASSDARCLTRGRIA